MNPQRGTVRVRQPGRHLVEEHRSLPQRVACALDVALLPVPRAAREQALDKLGLIRVGYAGIEIRDAAGLRAFGSSPPRT